MTRSLIRGEMRAEIAVFVPAAGNEDHRLGEVSQGHGHRAHVGAFGVVIKLHPVHLRHELQAVGQPAEGGQHPAAGRGTAPASRASNRAAMMFSRLWRPESWMSARGKTSSPASIQPDVQRAVGQPGAPGQGPGGGKVSKPGPARQPRAATAASSALRTLRSAPFWLLKQAGLGGAIGGQGGVAVQVVWGDVEQGGGLGMEVGRGVQLKAAHLQHQAVRRCCPASSEITGVPILPPTRGLSPEAWRNSPTRVMVVVLPLVPLTAMSGFAMKWPASSSSPQTGMPASRAAWSQGDSGGTPGLRMMRS